MGQQQTSSNLSQQGSNPATYQYTQSSYAGPTQTSSHLPQQGIHTTRSHSYLSKLLDITPIYDTNRCHSYLLIYITYRLICVVTYLSLANIFVHPFVVLLSSPPGNSSYGYGQPSQFNKQPYNSSSGSSTYATTMVASSGSRLSQLVAASNATKAVAPGAGQGAGTTGGYGGAVSTTYPSYGVSGNSHINTSSTAPINSPLSTRLINTSYQYA